MRICRVLRRFFHGLIFASVFTSAAFATSVHSQPSAIRKTEEATQPQIDVRGDGALAGYDLADALAGTPISLASR